MTRKSPRKRPDPRALPIESTGLGWGGEGGLVGGEMQLLGAATEWEELGWEEGKGWGERGAQGDEEGML